MRAAILGNVAGNSFALARALRTYTGVEADSYDYGGPQRVWCPQWEEADFDPIVASAAFAEGGRTWFWKDVVIRNGWQRPPWAKIQGYNTGPAWFDTQEDYEASLESRRNDFGRLSGPILDLLCRGKDALLPAPQLTRDRFTWPQQRQTEFLMPLPRAPEGWEPRRKWEHKLLTDVWMLPRTESVREIARHYDLLVLWGPEASNGLVLDRDTRYIACEHGTMRYVAQKNTTGRRLLAAAYQWADHCVLTNPDCVRDAKKLGLERYSFIPHPVDTAGKFRPLVAPLPPCSNAEAVRIARMGDEFLRWSRVAKLRNALLAWAGDAEVLFLAPARQSRDKSDGEKANSKVFAAYKRYLDEAEPKGAPRAHLLLAGWGANMVESHHLVRSLGIGPRVSWFPLLPKVQLADVYLAADVVLDQFADDCGSFGTTTVEALACGKPVITYVNPELNAWAFPQLPPILNALSEDDIYQAMVRLARSADERAQIGAASRNWVEGHHSARLVAEAHARLYEQVLEGRWR